MSENIHGNTSELPLSFILFHSEYIWKNNITDNDVEDTMEFDVWRKYIFRSDLSNGLTGDEIVTTLHPGINRSFEKINYTQICIDFIQQMQP